MGKQVNNFIYKMHRFFRSFNKIGRHRFDDMRRTSRFIDPHLSKYGTNEEKQKSFNYGTHFLSFLCGISIGIYIGKKID